MSRAQLTSTVEQNTGGAVAPFLAGKNKLINGDCAINQRAFSSTSTDQAYSFDRWQVGFGGTAPTYSAQTFTIGTAPVVGYEAKNYFQIVSTQSASTDFAYINQRIEGVRTLAGQSAVISFWAKAASGTPNVGVNVVQVFGTGGSPSANVNTTLAVQAISTTWTRYSFTVSVPSISGKTIGTAGDDCLRIQFFVSCGTAISASGYPATGAQSGTFSLWGFQVENGSVATPFTTASGTLQGELALCQRYFYIKNGANGASGTSEMIGLGTFYNSTIFRCPLQFPVQMRTAPSFVSANAASYFQILGNSTNNLYSTVTLDYSTPTACNLNVAVSSATGGQSAWLQTNSGSSFLQFSAEL